MPARFGVNWQRLSAFWTYRGASSVMTRARPFAPIRPQPPKGVLAIAQCAAPLANGGRQIGFSGSFPNIRLGMNMINWALRQSFFPIAVAAAQLIHPHSLVHQKMPVLRFQFPCGQGRSAGSGVCRCLIAGFGRRCPALCGKQADPEHFHRRRHAEPVFAESLRPPAGRNRGTYSAGRRYRNYARSESRHLRKP